MTDEISLSQPRRTVGVAKPLVLVGKLVFSAACFWYVLRQINVSESVRALETFDVRWVVFAVLVAMTRIPLFALRLRAIVLELLPNTAGLTYLAANMVTAFYSLLAQVMPSVVGETVRAWMLIRCGCEWRVALAGVILDRGVGIASLVAFTFFILLLPSGLTGFSGYHDFILYVFGAALALGVVTLFLAPRVAPFLARWRYSYWIGMFVTDAHRVFLGSRSPVILAAAFLVHASTIVMIWSVGRAEGLALSVSDCAVLFVVMVGVTLIPISVGGWGLRELAVVSLLGAHGFATERALLLSLCFGLVVVISALPGAIVWPFCQLPSAATNGLRR